MEENQGTIHAVKTKAHLHIPMASGNVIKIPLAAIQEPSHNINISNEVNQSGLWKHIASESHMSCSKEGDDKYATYVYFFFFFFFALSASLQQTSGLPFDPELLTVNSCYFKEFVIGTPARVTL